MAMRILAISAALGMGLASFAGQALACTGSPNDPVHCVNNAGQAINGFGSFFDQNLQQPFGPPGATFLDDAGPGAGDLGPVGVSSEESDAEALEDYLAGQRAALDAQRESLEAARQRLQNARDALASGERDGDRTVIARAQVLIESAERALDRATALVAATEARIENAEASGTVPEGPDRLLSQFPGNDALGAAGAANSGPSTLYEDAKERGGFTGTTVSYGSFSAGLLGLSAEADGSTFVREAPGHSTSGPGRNPTGLTVGNQELLTVLGGGDVHSGNYLLMTRGVLLRLAEAIERGDVEGTVDYVNEDSIRVTVLPGGLDAAKPYLDVMESLDRTLEEDRRTQKTQEQRIEEAEQEEEAEEARLEFLRRNAAESAAAAAEKGGAVGAADAAHHTSATAIRSIIDDLEPILPGG